MNRQLTSLFCSLVVAVTVHLAFAPASLWAAATTYYVATDGKDTHDGLTSQAPFRTIQKAAEVMQPGDTCMIRGGEYREKIVPLRGGSSVEARITYRAYRNEKPVIKGSERVAGWTDEGGGSTCVVCLEKPCEIVFAQCGMLSSEPPTCRPCA
jgi:hypothetical protein